MKTSDDGFHNFYFFPVLVTSSCEWMKSTKRKNEQLLFLRIENHGMLLKLHQVFNDTMAERYEEMEANNEEGQTRWLAHGSFVQDK